MFLLIEEWRDSDSLVRAATGLLAKTGDVLVAVVDFGSIQSFPRAVTVGGGDRST